MQVYPQVLVNVPGVDRTRSKAIQKFRPACAKPKQSWLRRGGFCFRASGTEPLVRVMVEAADEGTAQSWADRIARVVERRLAL
jgi:phosphoglucosamine mutase